MDGRTAPGLDGVEDLIDKGSAAVCVIGIGRIGLPTALSFAKAGFRTVGVDINADLVGMIRNGEYPLKDEPGYGEVFDHVTAATSPRIVDRPPPPPIAGSDVGRFSATTRIEEAVPVSHVILLSLPTPMDRDNVPDYTALRTVGGQLKNLARPGSVIVVESTVEPGFVEDEFVRLASPEGGVGIGVCPETANPGEIMRDFEKLPRMIGATDERTLRIIEKLYGRVFPVEMVRMPDCRTANAVKLTTNVFRDVNIAFVNELAVLFERLGIDTRTVLEAADKKYNFQVHYPGPGVGGPCLPVNSYQMLNSAGPDKTLLRLVRTGRRINESMPHHVVGLLSDALGRTGRRLESSTVLILGVSYKPDVRDVQLSPAEVIVSELSRSGADVRIFDPHFSGARIYGIQTAHSLDDALPGSDAAVIVTAHREFERMDPRRLASCMRTPVLVDTRGVTDVRAAERAGLTVRVLGGGSGAS